MRISTPQDLGLYLRERRRELGLSQADLAAAAQVSRRWLSEVEHGKSTAEIGLVLNTMHTLNLMFEASPTPTPSVDLDALLNELDRRP